MNLAPNGKKSNLTKQQYRLVRTPAFKKWFGDWENSPETASKVIDENGEPLIVHHGGSYTKGEFKGVGWFARDKSGAKYYAKQNNGVVISVFLSIKKPYYAGQVSAKEYRETNNAVLFAQKNKEYDGVIDKDIMDCIVWKSNQIKVADGSNTTFNVSNPDIRFKDGGEVGDGIKMYKNKAETTNSIYYTFIQGNKKVKIRLSDHPSNSFLGDADLELNLDISEDKIKKIGKKLLSEQIDKKEVTIGDKVGEYTIEGFASSNRGMQIEVSFDDEKKYPAKDFKENYIKKYFDESQRREMVIVLGKSKVFIPKERFEKQYNVQVVRKNKKLADGTNTTFDANNDDIRYEGGGNIDFEYTIGGL